MTQSGSANRLFFALWPSAAAAQTLAQRAKLLQERGQLGGRLMPAARLHLTLHFLGAVGPAGESAALQAAGEVTAEAFELRFDQAGTFRGRGRPCWLAPSAVPPALTQLHAALADRLQAAGLRTDADYHPHLTVLRDIHHPLKTGAIEPVSCRFSEFLLVRSVLDRQPVEYQPLRRFALR